MSPFVCLKCRKTFKRHHRNDENFKPCPNCGMKAIKFDVRFRAPKKTDSKQWKKVEFLTQNGFVFQKVYQKMETGGLMRVNYPSTLEEAREFVRLYKDQAVKYE